MCKITQGIPIILPIVMLRIHYQCCSSIFLCQTYCWLIVDCWYLQDGLHFKNISMFHSWEVRLLILLQKDPVTLHPGQNIQYLLNVYMLRLTANKECIIVCTLACVYILIWYVYFSSCQQIWFIFSKFIIFGLKTFTVWLQHQIYCTFSQ